MPLIRSAGANLYVEICVRIALLSAFCCMDFMYPFIRVIQTSDLDSSLKYPRHESYVPGYLLWCIVLAVPCVLSLVAWAVCHDGNDALEFVLAWSLALGLNGVTTNMIKLIAGRPRPDYFYRCFPNGIETMDLQCTGDLEEVMDGRKSFPSGHSSLSWCSLGAGCLWLSGRLQVMARRRGVGARLVLCAAPLLLAAAVSLSRSCDYHHHWEDILFGSILGFTAAVFCYRQYYNPLSSDLAGVPYIVSNVEMAQYVNGNLDISPSKEKAGESTPLVKKEDKWI